MSEAGDKENSKISTKSNRKISKNENLTVANFSKRNKALEKRTDKGENALHVACPLEKVELLNEGYNQIPNTSASFLPVASSSFLPVASSLKLNKVLEKRTTKSAKMSEAGDKENSKTSTKSNRKISKNENLTVANFSKRNKALEKRTDKCENALNVACPLEKVELLNEGYNQMSNASTSFLPVASSSFLSVASSSFLPVASFSKLNKVLEKRNIKGETALHIACRHGKVDRVVELLNKGANPNTKNNAGWTPLHEVVQNDRLDLVKLLLQHNTLINVPGYGNKTPLHEAVRYKRKGIVNELVRHGADLYARNCKGETPVQLASNEIKKVLEEAAENIIQTQDVIVTHIIELQTELAFDDIRIYCISQFLKVYKKLKELCKHHKNVHIEAKFTKKVTHLLVDTKDDLVCPPNLDVLQGIVYGIWILSYQWVIESTKEKLQPFNNYEVKGVGTTKLNGPKNARYNKYKQLPGIFNGCHFYLHNFNTDYEISKTIIVNKTILSKLITEADGIVLRRAPNPEFITEAKVLVPYHAKKGGILDTCSYYIIFKDMYEPMYNMKHFKALPFDWLIECIEKYELCEPE